ncbi:hypothetical protein NDU88_001298 [Pleurodeles waltl]|uniref:Uncharacterized protein n=1 Tax=Pleurodeles waltl TaxID=8319 RepID=A0AAV7R8N1_PLEWA|nr:hypothetical protein NDU88_001298 [Pleurodeles waltl]
MSLHVRAPGKVWGVCFQAGAALYPRPPEGTPSRHMSHTARQTGTQIHLSILRLARKALLSASCVLGMSLHVRAPGKAWGVCFQAGSALYPRPPEGTSSRHMSHRAQQTGTQIHLSILRQARKALLSASCVLGMSLHVRAPGKVWGVCFQAGAALYPRPPEGTPSRHVPHGAAD